MSQQSYHPLLELIKARLREFWREKGLVFWVFGFPLLMAMGLGLAFRNRPPEVPSVAVVADPRASLARALIESDRLDATLVDAPAAERGLSRAKFDLMVALSDGVEPVFTFDPMQDRAALAKAVTNDVLQRAAGRVDALQPSEVRAERPGSRYIDFLLPGLIGLNLMGSSMWGVGYNLVVARKRRLLRRYAVTPMRRIHFLLAYFCSRSMFLVLELSVLLVFGWLVFDTALQGRFVDFLLFAVLGAASFAAISLMIGARVENTEAANGWMNLVQLPMWVLSGAFFSYERFPEWMHPLIRWMPLASLVDGLRAIFVDGASLVALWYPGLVLVVWGAVGFFVALRWFRWQ